MVRPNILIVGPHRSGSTNLMNSLSKILGSHCIEEPWNYYLHSKGKYDYPFFLKDYGVVKSLIEQKAAEWKKPDIVDFYLHCIELFDYVIILNRKDRIALAESYARQMQFGEVGSWHVKYIIEDTSVLNLELDKINTWCDNINELSKKSNIPVTWYEELYSGDKVKFTNEVSKWNLDINIDSFFNHFNPKNRYRKFINKQTTI